MTEFRETQRIDKGLLVFLALMSIGAIVGPLVLTYQEAVKATGGDGNDTTVEYLLIASGAFVFTALVFSLVASQRLEIDSFRVEKAKWFQKMRKSRMHYNPFTKKASYMMTRKYFVELKLINGKTILLSTNMPDEMLNALTDFKLNGK